MLWVSALVWLNTAYCLWFAFCSMLAGVCWYLCSSDAGFVGCIVGVGVLCGCGGCFCARFGDDGCVAFGFWTWLFNSVDVDFFALQFGCGLLV